MHACITCGARARRASAVDFGRAARPPQLALHYFLVARGPDGEGETQVQVCHLLRVGDPKSAGRAARTLSEFVEAQMVHELAERQRRRRQRDRGMDSRLWLDDHYWLAWTICGQFFSVEEIERGSMRGSPAVRRDW